MLEKIGNPGDRRKSSIAPADSQLTIHNYHGKDWFRGDELAFITNNFFCDDLITLFVEDKYRIAAYRGNVFDNAFVEECFNHIAMLCAERKGIRFVLEDI